jgi:aminoglycoside 3-N-acetyltransferase
MIDESFHTLQKGLRDLGLTRQSRVIAGRKQFVRWALTPPGVVECVAWPGCSRGFEAIARRAGPFTREAVIGLARVRRLPLRDLLRAAEALIRMEPNSLLCDDPACERCNAVRAANLSPSFTG